VDVIDNREEKHGYRFTLVNGTTLPFDDGVFDLVITNHVIEHVGDETLQLAHLAEIKRVTAEDGLVYLAVPNKWRFMEPHYRLPLLSWLPGAVSDAYLRLTRRATYYDCTPRSRKHLVRLFRTAGLAYADQTIITMRQMLALEYPDSIATRFVNSACPDWLLRMGRPFVPTLVFLLRHPSAATQDPEPHPSGASATAGGTLPTQVSQ
jgi:SAM-dependent methyltransferase